ncbi:MAG: hypothetical protein A2V21_313260 [Deltaproteobacteria bacterium GWC2_55_46]|nr:MAG: hypothetical protein A2Z79_07440 [Deltaproteobacteria bacterium GWA2_55_82]OGQ64751.1 MAG: hypothetical protein A3I81_00240 [Deltaproteobacteria bacterium RIFCSPLOWO2_02_FULL_55_12]OIJ72597.1 MAG: hypothetical protein A2V21_313260 [Deltaproteobacteria bacterium GWC2_55_46]HCY11941.1 sugar phosphate isomerase/epimerase [Deltaproteobacteria bacterium]
MRFSFSTNAFIRNSVVEAVEKIAAAGYEGVELLADTPHLYMHDVKEADIRKLKTAISRTGIKVSNINANTVRGYSESGHGDPLFEPCLTDPDREIREWRVDYTKRCVDLARHLGSANVSVTSGPIQPETTPEESIELLKKSLKSIVRYAEEKRVFVGLEYEPGLLIESSSELVCLINEIGSSSLGANLDLGHSHLLGEEPASTLDLLEGKIFHVRLEEIKGRRQTTPGAEEMDFRHILSLFQKNSYHGFITLDLYAHPLRPEEAARKSVQFLKGMKVWNGDCLGNVR